jgi:hypothetical protein
VGHGPLPGAQVTGSEASGLAVPVAVPRDVRHLARQVEAWEWVPQAEREAVNASMKQAALRGPDALSGAIAEHVWRGAQPESLDSRLNAELAARRACGLGSVQVDPVRLARTIDTLPNWGHLSTRERHALHFDVVTAAKAGPGAVDRALEKVVGAGVPPSWAGGGAWEHSARLALQGSIGEAGVLRRERGETIAEIHEIRTVDGTASIQPGFVARPADRAPVAPEKLWPEGVLIDAHEALRKKEVSLTNETHELGGYKSDLNRVHQRVVASGREFLGQLGAVVADPEGFQRVFRALEPERKRSVLDALQSNPRTLEARLGPVGKLATTARLPATPSDERAVRAAPAVARHGHAYLDGLSHYRDRIAAVAEKLGLPAGSSRTTITAEVDSRLTAAAAKLAQVKAERLQLGPEPERGAAFNRVSLLGLSEQRAVALRFPEAAEAMKEISRSRLVVVFARRQSRRDTIVDHSGRHKHIQNRNDHGLDM